MSLQDLSISEVPLFLRLIVGLTFSISVTIMFIGAAWYDLIRSFILTLKVHDMETLPLESPIREGSAGE